MDVCPAVVDAPGAKHVNVRAVLRDGRLIVLGMRGRDVAVLVDVAVGPPEPARRGDKRVQGTMLTDEDGGTWIVNRKSGCSCACNRALRNADVGALVDA